MNSNAKMKKKNLPRSTAEMSKEMLQETLKKKKECNTRALEIVETLSEGTVEEGWFLSHLEFINQSHFEDVMTERSISKMCGYPLCWKKLGIVSAQKYHISTRYNKVYDITERKNFCSSVCYKAAMYVKAQLLTGPLWFRDHEELPKFTLLKSPVSSMGEEVVFKDTNITVPDEAVESKAESENNLDEPKAAGVRNETDTLVDNEDNKEKYNDSSGKEKIKEKSDSGIVSDSVTKVENFISEWFSLDTLLYLYGEDKVKEMFSDQASKLHDLLNSKTLICDTQKIDQLSRYLALLDIGAFNSSSIRELKPLPNYSVIREEGQKMQVKVKAFMGGQLEIKETVQEVATHQEETDKVDSGYLPLVDAHAQNALRRRIVMDRLNRVVPELLLTLSANSALEIKEVRDLIIRMTLSAHNITMKPTEWHLMALIIIKMLSVRNTSLSSRLSSDQSKKHLTLFLMSYNLQQDYLDNIMEWLTNTDRLLEKFQ